MGILKLGQDSTVEGDAVLYALEGNKKEHRVSGEEEKGGWRTRLQTFGCQVPEVHPNRVSRSQHWASGL